MKEIKDKKIEVRVTAAEKERIQKFCAEHDLKMSDFFRMASEKLMLGK